MSDFFSKEKNKAVFIIFRSFNLHSSNIWFITTISGEPGSCLPVFSPMPYLFCERPQNEDENCRFAARNDYSYWLNTDERQLDREVIRDEQISRYISRCSVCQTDKPVIAVHSQSMEVPACPRDWETMWIGYSFTMAS